MKNALLLLLFCLFVFCASQASAQDMNRREGQVAPLSGASNKPSKKIDQKDVHGRWLLMKGDLSGKKTHFEEDNILVVFSSSEVTVSGGCNKKSGVWRTEQGRLKVDSLRSTLMACSPERLMEMDDLLSRVLRGDPIIARSKNHLVLATPEEKLLFLKTK